MSEAPVLEAIDIVKELGSGAGKVRAVKGASLTLVPGELTLLMGPSGSGKTTLLSILGLPAHAALALRVVRIASDSAASAVPWCLCHMTCMLISETPFRPAGWVNYPPRRTRCARLYSSHPRSDTRRRSA